MLQPDQFMLHGGISSVKLMSCTLSHRNIIATINKLACTHVEINILSYKWIPSEKNSPHLMSMELARI